MNLTWALKWDLDDEEGKKGKSLQKGQQNGKGTDSMHWSLKDRNERGIQCTITMC